MQVMNGIPATQLPMARWRKSRASNPSGCCVEVATLPDGAIAMRNSRDPAGPALVYTPAEVAAFLTGVKNGEFDDLCPGGSVVLSLEAAAAASGLLRPDLCPDQRPGPCPARVRPASRPARRRPRARPSATRRLPGYCLRLAGRRGMANLAVC